MGDETPRIVVASPFGELTVTAYAPSYPQRVELDVKGSQPLALDGQQFVGFSAAFALSEGKLRASTVIVHQRRDDGRLSQRTLASAARKSFQAELKKALLARTRELLQLEMTVLELLEERLAAKKQTLLDLGASPPGPRAAESSVLSELLGPALSF